MQQIQELKNVSAGTQTRDYYQSHCGAMIPKYNETQYIGVRAVAIPNKVDAFFGKEYYIGTFFAAYEKKETFGTKRHYVFVNIEQSTDKSCDWDKVDLNSGSYNIYLYK